MTTALIIGDSHVDPTNGMPFGQELVKLLLAQGYDVWLNGVGATNAYLWANTNPVCNSVGRCVNKNDLPKNPDLLLVSLGTNDAAGAARGGGQSVTQAVADLQKTIGSFAPKSSIWIGPPWMRETVQYYTNDAMAKLYAAASNANVPIFDSRPATQQAVQAGSGDGVHLGAEGAQVWAAAVMQSAKKSFPWLTLFGIAAATAAGVWFVQRR
jgi:lysophospholipase L1-like esterase